MWVKCISRLYYACVSFCSFMPGSLFKWLCNVLIAVTFYTVQQNYCIMFCHKLGNTHTETNHKIQQVFSNNAIVVIRINGQTSKNGWTSVDRDHRSGRPSTSPIPFFVPDQDLLAKHRIIQVPQTRLLVISVSQAERVLTWKPSWQPFLNRTSRSVLSNGETTRDLLRRKFRVGS